ncbi:hypothetical protein V8E36_008140 [Tilletia maclaganii]
MFKKPPQLKTSSPLKSSERRKLLAHVQAAYPILAHAPADILARLVPDGLRQANALTSSDDKCSFFTDHDGVPLWFELGGHVGVALSAAKSNKNKPGSNQPQRIEGEIVPSLYALWIHPFILPHLPTWTTVIQDHMLGGSALMIPGLRLPPETFRPLPVKLFADESVADDDARLSAAASAIPEPEQLRAHSLVAITPSDSLIPLVVGRLEVTGTKLIELRLQPGGKGKAAKVVHSYRDAIWEMGGKVKAPADADIDFASLIKKPGDDEAQGAGQIAGEGDEDAGDGPADGAAAAGNEAEQSGDKSEADSQVEQQPEAEDEEDLAAALEAVLMGNDVSEDEADDPSSAAAAAAESSRKSKGKGKGKKGKKHQAQEAPHDDAPDAAATQGATTAESEKDGPSLSAAQVDVVLRLALLNALASHNAESASKLLPLPASSLYSAHVLPNRPSHLPPRIGKGKGSSRSVWEGYEAWKSRTSVNVAFDSEYGEEVSVAAEDADVKRSTAKQLKKWIKACEKDGLLKTKEVRGELTVMELNVTHSELQPWVPLWTIADESAKAASAGETRTAAESAAGSAAKKASSAPERMGVLVQTFFSTKAENTRELFESIGLQPQSFQSASSLRAALLEYVAKRSLAHPTDQALVRVGDDPVLAAVLRSSEPGNATKKKGESKNAPAAPAAAAPPLKPLRREEISKRVQESLLEYHRLCLVRNSTAHTILSHQTRSDPTSSELVNSRPFRSSLTEDEQIGAMVKGKPTPISVSIKQRQGRKLVTLISGLEPFGVDPKLLATELAREVGAATSVTALPSSTPKKPRVEVLVQGDMRKPLFKYLEEEAGIDVARLVSIKDDAVAKKK